MTEDERLQVAFLVKSGLPFDRAFDMGGDERQVWCRAFAKLEAGNEADLAGVVSITMPPVIGRQVHLPAGALPDRHLRQGAFKNYPPIFARDAL